EDTVTASDTDISGLLQAWASGDVEARDTVLPLVHRELRRLAGRYLRKERPGHTLQPTALINEAYLKLAGQDRVVWQNRAHFFGVAAQMMRRILVDHARTYRSARRQGSAVRVELDEAIGATEQRSCELMMLDEALEELTAIDARQARIVEYRYFAGMSEEEVAEVMSLSRSTVTREWQTARAWLYRRMTGTRKRSGDGGE